MLKFGSNFNGAQGFNFIHGFRRLVFYSTSISTESNPAFVNYLVESLGFPTQHALSTSDKLSRVRQHRGVKKVGDFNFVENADSVIKFLTKIGFEHSHIRNVVVSAPEILLCNVNKTLIPKTQTIHKMGISGPDFIEVVKVNPSILLLALNSKVVPAIQALKEIMGCDLHVIAILKKSRGKRFYCISRNLVPNVALLRNYGIPIESIQKYVLKLSTALVQKTELLKDVVIRVEEKLGIPRDSPQFLFGIHLLSSLTEKNIQLKREIFKNFGWTESDVVTLFRKCPTCFGLSVASIKKKLDFLMNELNYEPSFLAMQSNLLTCSLEKRIVPRHKVLLVLKEKGLIKIEYSFITAVKLSESQFLKRFVLPFTEVHEVYREHSGTSLEVLTLGSSKPDSDATSC
ncbi:hypothetical protein SOVF_055130 [Spinacia oleracea]|uniref:Transcription termination factor MTERF9, chloroplastic n=1 Tax=Spinacia oleracea TaxID=3562 RepID=A0A9R0HT10_SPIOL|nr:transcription termination factor MTERF9, chloroplastic-like [Spinacia oleracea]KNA20139.1 hypothetical protein SOVF_055130 [Spinacia oleracea]